MGSHGTLEYEESAVHPCKNHGGLSTGPKTAEGIERIRRATLKHGRFTKESDSTIHKGMSTLSPPSACAGTGTTTRWKAFYTPKGRTGNAFCSQTVTQSVRH
jgi:hypothetical protein